MSEENLNKNNIKNSENSSILDKRLFKENSYIREIFLFLMIIGLVYFSTLFYGGLGETGKFIRLLFISIIIVLSFRNLVFSGKTIEWFKRNTILFLWIIFFFGYLIFQFFFASVNKLASLKSLFALFYSVVFFAALLNFNWEELRFKFFKAIIFWGFVQAVLVIIQKIFLIANSGGTPQNPIILNTLIFKTLGIVGTAGTFFNPNFMVDFLFPIIIISVTLIINAKLSKFIKTVLSLNAILMFAAIFLSGSRGGIIAFLISITLILLFSKKRIYLAIIPVFLTLFILIPNPLRTKIWKGTEGDTYIYKRIDINKASLQMFLKKPIFGYGTGTYENVARRFKFPVPGGASKYRMVAEQAHNEVAQFIVENGIVGGVFLLILVIWLIIMVILNRRKYDFYDYILIGIIVGLLAHSIVDFNLRVPGVFIPFMIFLAILLRKDEDDSESVFFGGELRWLALVTLIFILLNVIVITNFIGLQNKNKGLEYLHKKNLELATDKLFFATHLSHFDSEAHRLLGLCYMYQFYKDASQTNYEDCLAEFALAMRYDSMSALIPFNIASFYENLYFMKISNDQKASYELTETISYYRAAIEREPTLVLYRYRLAKFLFRINRNKNALEELEIALEYEENYINAHLLKSMIFRRLGQDTKALAEFKLATEIDNKFLDSKTLNTYDKQLLHIDEFLKKFFQKED